MPPSQISSGTFTPRGGAASHVSIRPIRVSTRVARLAQRSALAVIRGYQLLLSPMFAGSCRFEPSCSVYAAEAITRFGLVRGCGLALRRLARCHPFGGHGVDPVPAGDRHTH
jgi:uncharacterized protein